MAMSADVRAQPADQAPAVDGSLSPVPWPAEPRERCDFYHRTRTFPEDVARWRREFVRKVNNDQEHFPAASVAGSGEAIRDLVDEGVTYLREIARMLALLYGTPRLGNKEDPVDE